MKTDISAPLILGIETSCDETGVGIVHGNKLLADEISSSVTEQARYGGVVPEVASRAHLEAMVPTIRRALAKAKISLQDLDGIAVTAGPGLVGALLVGTAAAKGLAVALGVPIYGVNHLTGHVLVDELEHGSLPSEVIALLVSGGHSSILKVGCTTEELGATLDDAAGEAFDKVARLLGLGFPGGQLIDNISAGVDPEIDFPRGLTRGVTGHSLAGHEYDFSFSGLKTAVRRYIENELRSSGTNLDTRVKKVIAASFQEAVVDVLTIKAIAACVNTGLDTLVIGGGVAANSRLRSLATERCAAKGIQLRVPSPGLCTDNGAMIAAVGARLMSAGVKPSEIDFPTTSVLDVSETLVSPSLR